MPITSNTIQASDIDSSTKSAEWGFVVTNSDTDYLEDPDNAGIAVVTRAITLIGEGAVKVEFASGREVTIPSGYLAAGIMHPMNIVKVFATGTTTTVFVWI